MPGRAIKDETRPEEEEKEELPQIPLNELLLTLDETQQVELIAIIKEDYRNGTEARKKD